MPPLQAMPVIQPAQADLLRFGQRWQGNGGALKRTPPESSNQLGQLFNEAVGRSLATMLGGVPVVKPRGNALMPAEANCVEVGEVRVVGGVRPQNFDVGYRPDGVRFVLDSKTLNDTKSVGKNYQNMINDLATEATTVHMRFPNAVVAFIIAIPSPCLVGAAGSAIISRLDGLASRPTYVDPPHMAEVIALAIWDPATGTIDANRPDPASVLRIEKFSQQVYEMYRRRYAGMPPHD